MEPTAVSVFVPYFLLSIGERKDVSDSSWPKHFTEVKFPRRMESLGHKPLHQLSPRMAGRLGWLQEGVSGESPLQFLLSVAALLGCICALSHSVASDSWSPHGLQPARQLCPWNSPGEDTEVGSHVLLQGIFLTQGSNPGLLHCG